MTAVRRSGIILGLVALAGCAAPAVDHSCRAEQRNALGQCCVGWQVPDGDRCESLGWVPPSVATILGEPGAVRIEAAVDGDEHGVVAWQANADERIDTRVVVADQDDDGWTTFEPGQPLPGFGLAPTVAADEIGRALVTWKQQQTDAAAVYFAERGEDGTWALPSADQPLSLPPTADEPRPLFAPSGETLVIWNQWTGSGYGVAVARRPRNMLEGPLQRPADATDVLSPPVNVSSAPQPAVAGNGDAVITWSQSPHPTPSDATELVVFASERTRESGDFSRPAGDAFLSPADAPVDSRAIRNPRATISDVGEIVIAWTQDDGAGSVPVYIAHRTGLGVWTVPAGLGDAFSVREGRAVSAQPAFGADAEVFLVWAQDRGSGHAVWSAHRRGDGTWDVPGTAPELLSTLGAEAVEPRLSVGVDGQAGVLWQERTDDSWRVMVRRRNPGADRWSAARQLSADDGRDATAPTLAIGPTGAALAAWLTGAPSRRRVTVVTTQLPRDPDDP